MRLQSYFGLIGAVLIGACTQQGVPDSGQGAGHSPTFSQFEIDRARREAQLAGTPVVNAPLGIVPGVVPNVVPNTLPGAAPVATSTLGGIAPSQLSAAGIGAQPLGAPLTAGSADPLRTGGVQASPGNAAPVIIASTGISDEQDFDAVATRESIESDAARRAQQAAAYQVIAPEALPARTETGPNIVQYALAAPNRLGQEWYSRSILSGQSRFSRNCSQYRSPDDAQRDFLARGGPDRDPSGIDPDGDGFACGWDPAPFLAAVGRG